MLGVRGRFPDPQRSTDPAVRELVSALATLPSPAPRAHFRAELRAQLVAVAPRLVAEGRAEAEAAAAPQRAERARPHVRIAAGIRIAVAALAACAVLLGGAVWLSQSALPGDALYGLKRASENAQLALASDGHQRATDLLAFAKTRADEVSELLSQASATAAGAQADGAISAAKASLIRSTLGSADDDLRQASQLLGGQAVRDRSGSPLDLLLSWAPGQQDRLGDVAGRIPAGDLRDAALASADLVAAAVTRAKALQANVGCSCLGGGGSDSLGPRPCLPCQSGPARQTTAPATPTVPAPTRPGHPGVTSTRQPPAPATSTSNAPAPQGSSGSGGSAGSGGSSGGVLPPLPTSSLPSLPLPLPTVSLPPLTTTSSCTPAVTIGPIKIGCGLSVGI
jgi:hypothetical protein